MKSAPSRAIAPTRSSPLSPAQKAAIVLASLPRETAAAIVAEIGDAHLKAFVRAVGQMRSVPAQARFAVAQEFIAEVLRKREELPSGSSEAHRILSELTDKARADKLIAEMDRGAGDDAHVWQRIAGLPNEQIIGYLRGQRLPAIAAVFSNLPAERVADILAAAPPEFGQTAIAALARIERPDDATSRAIAFAIEEELVKPAAASSAASAVNSAVNDIFDLLPASFRDGLIAHLERADAGIAAAIRKSLLTFQHLPARLSENAVAALVRTAERDVFLRALKQGEINSAETVDFLLANMSKRMADQFREELAALPAPTIVDGEKAQRAMIAAVKTLEKAGEIKLNPVT